MKPCKIPQNKTTCGVFKKGGPLDNCKKRGARGDRLIRLTQYPPLYLKISGFGGSSVTDFMDLVQFQLKPLHQTSDARITIKAHVKDGEICSPLESAPFDVTPFDYLAGLQFADPIPRGESRVDILLGGQQWRLVHRGRAPLKI